MPVRKGMTLRASFRVIGRSNSQKLWIALVVRNGHAQSRNVTVGAGTIAIEAPRVNDKRVVNGEKQKFTSQILV